MAALQLNLRTFANFAHHQSHSVAIVCISRPRSVICNMISVGRSVSTIRRICTKLINYLLTVFCINRTRTPRRCSICPCLSKYLSSCVVIACEPWNHHGATFRRKRSAVATDNRHMICNGPLVAPPSHRNVPLTVTSQVANTTPDMSIHCHQESAARAFQSWGFPAGISHCIPTIVIRYVSKTCWIWTKIWETKMIGHTVRTMTSTFNPKKAITHWIHMRPMTGRHRRRLQHTKHRPHRDSEDRPLHQKTASCNRHNLCICHLHRCRPWCPTETTRTLSSHMLNLDLTRDLEGRNLTWRGRNSNATSSRNLTLRIYNAW